MLIYILFLHKPIPSLNIYKSIIIAHTLARIIKREIFFKTILVYNIYTKIAKYQTAVFYIYLYITEIDMHRARFNY